VTIFTDLAVAVFVGVIVAALVFAWESAKHINADTHIDKHGSKIYKLQGPLFFGSINNFNNIFDIKNDPEDVIVDFQYSRVWDHSGLEAIDSLAIKYSKAKKELHLRHLSKDCYKMLKAASDVAELNYTEDPDYFVIDD
jgi:SulP family sulfate permease